MVTVKKARLADGDSIVAVDCILSGNDVRVEKGRECHSRSFYLLPEDYACLELVPGPLDAFMLEELKRLDEKCRALRTSRRLLEFSSNTEAGLVTKLRQRGFSKQASEFAASLCAEEGAIDETRDAIRAAELIVKKGRGLLRVIPELRQKGYGNEAVDAALGYLSEVDFSELCRKVIASKWKRFPEEPDARRKAVASLLRLGFTGADIKNALKK